MNEDVRIEFNGRSVAVPRGKPLLAGLVRAGARPFRLCGGRGLCSTCRVVIEEGADRLSPMGAGERVSLRGHLSFSRRVRLACQARVEGNVRVRSVLPELRRAPAETETGGAGSPPPSPAGRRS